MMDTLIFGLLVVLATWKVIEIGAFIEGQLRWVRYRNSIKKKSLK